MLTRMERRYRGSLQEAVNSTPSMERAAAERKMAPTLVGFVTFSSTTILRVPAQTVSGSGRLLRRMAHRAPLVRG